MKKPIIYTPHQNNETVLREKEGVAYFTFEALDGFSDRLVNAFSTRLGGFSKGIYESMNLGLNHADERENVRRNYAAFAKAIGVSADDFVISDQQHTTNLRIATKADCGKGVTRERDYEAIDGFLCSEPGVALCLLYADCVPVYLYDPKNEAIALLHSGWKGTLGQISEKAIRRMEQEYGTAADDVIAVIGPSICRDCYEVSADLYERFGEEYREAELAEIFAPGKDDVHYQLDLWKSIEITLLRAGTNPKHIHVTDVCTCHNPELLFSHRYTNGRRGNLAAVLMLR